MTATLPAVCVWGQGVASALPDESSVEAARSLEVAGLFSDGAVLQREKSVPVWGWASPGATVTVSFAGHEAAATCGGDGRWMVVLPAMSANGDGQTLTITAGDEQITFEDVLVGEVWLCGGQSNMAWTLRSSDGWEEAAAAAEVSTIRLFQVLPRVTAESPQSRLPHESAGANAAVQQWVAASPDTVTNFSAVGYHFGRRLHDELNVPVGLINSNWGGTRIEAWTSRPTLEATPEAQPVLADFDAIAADWDNVLARWEAAEKKPGFQTDPGDGDAATTQAWSSRIPDATVVKQADRTPMDTPQGQTVAAPIAFANDFDGVAWLYRTVEIPPAWAGVPLKLSLGAMDDFDVTFFAGTQVGQTGNSTPDWHLALRNYDVPGDLVEAGTTLIAVRLFDRWQGGGMAGPATAMSLAPADGDLRGQAALALGDGWTLREMHRQNPADVAGSAPPQRPYGPGHQQQPAGLYNAMIHPLVPYALRGAIWYQGESNAGRAEQYRALMPALIHDWRNAWADALDAGQQRTEPTDGPGDPLWFGMVQLANFRAFSPEPREDAWAELRDAQLQTTRHVARTGLAVTIDIGDADDIHPRNKRDVGQRLARWALHETYGLEHVVMAGPRFDAAWFEADTAHIRFDTFGSPLAIRATENEFPPALAGFTLAGPDRVFHPATAHIADDRHLLVHSDAVPNPVAVRYAWQINPADANLINVEGLPAGPFRSDDWPGVTSGQRVP